MRLGMADYRVQDRNRGIIGPVTIGTLKELIAAGVVSPEAVVSRDGHPFLAMGAFPELAPAAGARAEAPTEADVILPGTMLGVLFRLHRAKASGRLSVSRGPYRKDAYLREGELVFLSSNIESERLGQFLVQRQKLSREQLAIGLSSMHDDGNRLGDALIRLGLIGAEELEHELREHQLERIIELACWREGTYEFFGGSLFSGVDQKLRVSTPELIMRTAREMATPMLRDYLGANVSRRPLWTARDVDLALPWSSAESAALAQIDGRRTLAELTDSCAGDQGLVRHLLTTAYVLWAVGFVTFGEARPG